MKAEPVNGDEGPRSTPPVRPSRVRSTPGTKVGRTRREKPGVKKEQILEVAVSHFGHYGYEDTKWADVADAVGIGPTALYHYFVSKQHCLYEIMAAGLTDFKQRFDVVAANHTDWTETLVAQLVRAFDLTDQEILRVRILVAERGLMATHRELAREEAARSNARSLMRDLEFMWGTFLARGMQQGIIPEQDPKVLSRAVLGLHNSVWFWFRPGGSYSLAEVGKFYVNCQLRVLGCEADVPDSLFESWS